MDKTKDYNLDEQLKLLEDLTNKMCSNGFYIIEIRTFEEDIDDAKTIYLCYEKIKPNKVKKVLEKYKNYKFDSYLHDSLSESLIIFMKKQEDLK